MEKFEDSRHTLQDASDGGWLPLREASRRMGVSAATLRTWADDGRVASYRTPGGHRRFRVDAPPAAARGNSEATETRWRLLEYSALGRIRVTLEEWARAPGVFSAMSQSARMEHRALGRELVQLLVTALQQQGKAPLDQAARLGKQYAKLHRRYALDLHAAFTILGFFRSAFLASVVEFGFGLGDPAPQLLVQWMERTNEIIDGVGMAMLESMSEES